MCGFVGCFHPGAGADALLDQVRTMAATIVHRGPDSDGDFVDPGVGLAFSFRRLAVVDLTPTGAQPMTSPSGRYVCVFNGEIYNHHDLRAELAGVPWRGTSDTEVMLAALDRWGIADGVPRLHGMFAIAVWDREQQRLTLARDRIGEKPLYYGLHGGALLFGSELKALRAHSLFRSDIDRNALAAFMYASFVPGPATIWQSTWKLPPGSWLQFTAADIAAGRSPTAVGYWGLPPSRGQAGAASDHETVAGLDTELRAVLRREMEADVPLGAFLSGGIDSSTIVALMQAQSSRPVKTFTIGIPDDAGLDESAFAARVAAHLGTEHHSLQVTPADARAIIPSLGTMYDEPFADASQIPTHLVAALARQQVTVALSGDGGDELFGGYRRYLLAPKVARRTGHLPTAAARFGRAAITGVPVRIWDRLTPGLGTRAHQLASLLTNTGVDDVYHRAFGTFEGLHLVNGHGYDPRTLFDGVRRSPSESSDAVDRMMRFDALTYLPDDICAKVDRAAMAVSLETRMPFLDERIVQFAWSLPMHMLLRNGASKWVLRQVLAQYVPPSLTERPKAGFGIPLAAWLRGPLREWADDLLATDSLHQDGYLDAGAIGVLWEAHRSGRRDHTRVLWNVLMFQEWLDAQ
ncbi:MAG: asparagine synthase (glutamine-hydrolyzing) [Ilumatobacteraceae bacterium]